MANPLSDVVLAHYGVLGMKWGVRKGPLSSRVRDAELDFNQKRIDSNRRLSSGRPKLSEKVINAPARILLGKAKFEEVARNGEKEWLDQRDRIQKGKTNAIDKASFMVSIPLSQLVIKRV